MWTDELIDELKKLWAEGWTTGEIGKRIGVSKNAVVGKAHRLGLKGRPSPIKQGSADASSPKPSKESKTGFKSVADLSANACRWPIGDPRTPDFAFCCGSALPGKPYCAEHAAIAYVGTSKPPRSEEDAA